MEFEIIELYPPVVKVNGKLLTASSTPENDIEAKIVELLREYAEYCPYGRSLKMYELLLFSEIESIIKESE